MTESKPVRQDIVDELREISDGVFSGVNMSEINGEDTEWRAVTLPEGITRQGLAAFCLYGQPFGFTREDVKVLKEVAEYETNLAYDDLRHADAWVAPMLLLADRIEALLPPEGE